MLGSHPVTGRSMLYPCLHSFVCAHVFARAYVHTFETIFMKNLYYEKKPLIISGYSFKIY